MNKVKLLKFSANWCQPCIAMKSTVEMALNDTNIELVDINIDDNPDVVREYKVRSIPTLILVKGEEVVDRLTGRTSLAQVRALLGRA